jgi:hypothetical protein
MPSKNSEASYLKEIRDDIKVVKNMQLAQGQDIEGLKKWKIAEDAYRAALLQVRNEEKEKLAETAQKAWIKILKEVYPIIGILGAILYAYANSKGIH